MPFKYMELRNRSLRDKLAVPVEQTGVRTLTSLERPNPRLLLPCYHPRSDLLGYAPPVPDAPNKFGVSGVALGRW
jgi:hypothetical protein